MLLAWVNHEWLATRSNYHTADVILLLWNELWSQASSCQPAFHSSEARQAQAAGEAVNGHGNFTLSPLQVRMKLQCWEACTMLWKFIAVTAKRGSLRPSNMTCCITQTIQFELVTPCHIVLSFFLSLHHFLILFFFLLSVFPWLFFFIWLFLIQGSFKFPSCQFTTYKILLYFLKSEQNKSLKGSSTHICPVAQVLLQNQWHNWVKVVEIVWLKACCKCLRVCKALNTKCDCILHLIWCNFLSTATWALSTAYTCNNYRHDVSVQSSRQAFYILLVLHILPTGKFVIVHWAIEKALSLCQ